MNKYVAVFILFNIAVCVFAGVVFIAPVAASIKNGRASVRLQESRYSAESGLLAEYHDNLRALEELHNGRGVLSRNEMIPALSEISALGDFFGVTNVEFSASEMAESTVDEVYKLLEMRVRAEYQGSFDDLASFLHGFLGGYGTTRSFYFTDIRTETCRLRLEFSIFGVE